MAETSKIAWTDATWNPTTGCSHVSPGCENCYAEALSLRRGWSSKPWTKPNEVENVILHPDRLGLPLKWRTPRRVFVDSMSDLFHEQIPPWFLLKVWLTMGWTSGLARDRGTRPVHTYQVLTKRPDRMARWLNLWSDPIDRANMIHLYGDAEDFRYARDWPNVLPNVWLGVSVEDQRRADERIPLLLETPAAVRFLSCEPLLGPLDLSAHLTISYHVHPQRPRTIELAEALGELARLAAKQFGWPLLNWVIVGGESGPGYRPMDLDWARSLRDQCQAADVAFFFKQSSGARPGAGVELDGQIWHEFPQQTETGRSTEVHGAND